MARPAAKLDRNLSATDKLRVPPHSVEAEQAVLGGILLHGAAFDEVADRLHEADFYRHDHQLVWRAIAALASESRPIDVVTVGEWLEPRELLDEAGGMTYIGALAKDAPGAANIRAYGDIVRERATLRELIRIGNNIAQSAFAPEGRTPQELINDAQGAVMDVERVRHVGPQRLSSDYLAWVEDLDARANAENGLVGLPTGFADLDSKTLGMERGDVWIVAGRPGMGKTTFGMNVAEHTADGGGTSLIFEMEMPRRQLLNRTVASLARIDSLKLRSGHIDQVDWQRMAAAKQQLDRMPLFVDDTAALSITDMRARARRLKRQHGLDLVVIDYLQLMEDRGENRNQELAKITRGLKRMAKELDVPLLVLSQLNRKADMRGGNDRRPVKADLRDSGAIEQDADVIVFLYREAFYEKEKEFDFVAEAIIDKQRNGPTGRVLLHYNPALMRFDNLDPQDARNYRDWLRTKDTPAGQAKKGFAE